MPVNFIDFANVPSNDPVPAGEYPFVVENVEWRQSKDKIDPDTGELSEYWNWELAITDGDFQGRRLFFMTSLMRKSLWNLRGVLINLDAYEEQLQPEYDEDTNQVLSPELVGRTGIARVVMGSYKGEARSEVKKILDDDGVDREKAMRDERGSSNGKARVQSRTNGAAPTDDVPAGEAPAPERRQMKIRA